MLNRELGADFDLDAFSYVPFWDPRHERMDLRLRAEMPQHVHIPGADLDARPGAAARRSGRDLDQVPAARPCATSSPRPASTVERTWTDPADDFALTLARRDG